MACQPSNAPAKAGRIARTHRDSFFTPPALESSRLPRKLPGKHHFFIPVHFDVFEMAAQNSSVDILAL